MAWIESHQALGHHPKTLRLAAALTCSVPAAVGHLHFLWWWALDYAPDGLVHADDLPTVARACEWRGKSERFWTGLQAAGFVEQTGVDQVLKIHDWMDYAGRLVERRAANAERMRTARAKHVPRTSGTRAGATGPTNQPDRTGPTGPDQPVSPVSHSSAAAAAVVPGELTTPAPAREDNPLLLEHLRRIDAERRAAAAAAHENSFGGTNGDR